MTSSRDVNDLHPDLQPVCREFLMMCEDAGIDVIVTCTYRSNDDQDKLYAEGRTKPGKIRTNARGGQSMHNFTIDGQPAAKAFDVVPMRHGKCVWGLSGDGIDDNPADDDKDDLELWQRVGAIGEGLGLKWAARWKSFKEYPHFEMAA